jgi:hypothetical protein
MLEAPGHKTLLVCRCFLKICLNHRLVKKALMKGLLRAGQGPGGLWDLDLEFKKKICEFSRLIDSIFRFRAAKTGGNRSDRLISLKEGVSTRCPWCGEVPLWRRRTQLEELDWENLLARLSLGTMRSWDIKGETLA